MGTLFARRASWKCSTLLVVMLLTLASPLSGFGQRSVSSAARRSALQRTKSTSPSLHYRVARQAESDDIALPPQHPIPDEESVNATAPSQPTSRPTASHAPPEQHLWTDYCGGCSTDECSSCDGCMTCTSCNSCDDGFTVCETCPTTCERLWFRSEMLTWWLSGASTPALVTTSPDGTIRAEAGVMGFPATQILSGGERFGDEARLGTQVTLGGWIGCSHGLEGYWMYLGEDDSGDYRGTSVAGAPILARPFYNARDDIEDALLIGFPGVAEGTTRVESDSELQSAGLRLRQVIGDCGGSRFELLGGYRYLQFRDSLTITDNITILETGGLFQQGSTVDLQDIFVAENHWHGGELGVSTCISSGRVSLDLAGKLGLGGIRRRRLIAGSTIVSSPGGGVAGDNVGLLAAGTNSGGGNQYDFSMIPELNLKLRSNPSMHCGACMTGRTCCIGCHGRTT